MNSIQIFNHPKFGDIRTTGTPENPEFCAMDLCRALGYKNGRDALAKHVDTPDVAKRDMGVVTGKKSDGTDAIQTVSASFVNESGMFALILGSCLPQAKEFKRWVTSEVLPSIRKHGAYMTTATIEKVMNDPDSWIRLLQALKEERQQRHIAESKASLLEEVTKEQAPKVAFADAILSSPDSILIGELAKILCQRGYQTGEIRLYEQLRKEGYLCSAGSDYNMPMQRYLEMGLFEVTKGTRSGNGGIMHTTRTTKVTPKGQQYFINKFIAYGN
jgi:anti-repressor protein